MAENYDLNLIEKMNFDSDSVVEFIQETDDFAGRLTLADMQGMPTDSNDPGALRMKLSEYFYLKFDNNYSKLEALCDIKRNTFQKMLRFKGGRNVTYSNLAKFSVGAKLSVSQTKELFRYMGHELSDKVRYDYILLCELKNEGDVVEYDKSLRQFGFPGVLSSEDNLSSDSK